MLVAGDEGFDLASQPGSHGRRASGGRLSATGARVRIQSHSHEKTGHNVRLFRGWVYVPRWEHPFN